MTSNQSVKSSKGEGKTELKWSRNRNFDIFFLSTLYYLLREQDRLTILKIFYHPEHTKSILFSKYSHPDCLIDPVRLTIFPIENSIYLSRYYSLTTGPLDDKADALLPHKQLEGSK